MLYGLFLIVTRILEPTFYLVWRLLRSIDDLLPKLLLVIDLGIVFEPLPPLVRPLVLPPFVNPAFGSGLLSVPVFFPVFTDLGKI